MVVVPAMTPQLLILCTHMLGPWSSHWCSIYGCDAWNYSTFPYGPLDLSTTPFSFPVWGGVTWQGQLCSMLAQHIFWLRVKFQKPACFQMSKLEARVFCWLVMCKWLCIYGIPWSVYLVVFMVAFSRTEKNRIMLMPIRSKIVYGTAEPIFWWRGGLCGEKFDFWQQKFEHEKI